MNPADNLERAIEKLHVTTKAETDRHILNEAAAALRAAAMVQPAGIGARLWQAALTSRLAGPVAVAAAVTVGLALFFGLPGLIVLLAGITWGSWVVIIYQRTNHLAVGYALISVLLSIVGSLSLFAGVILHSVRGLLLELVTGERTGRRAV